MGMTPEAWLRHMEQRLRDAAEEAVRDAAAECEAIVRNRIPAERVRTRLAITAVPQQHVLRMKLKFAKQYRYQGTQTERLFQAAVRGSRKTLRNTLVHSLTKQLRTL